MAGTYRVVVWGPGYTGQQVIRELLDRPEFEVVGCLGYSPEKEGLDIGTLVGHESTGVTITRDPAEVIRLRPDVVLYAGRFMMDAVKQDGEVIALLEAGINVAAATAYHFPWQRGEAHYGPIERACAKGGSTLLGTGIHPGWAIERVAPLMTGLCTRVDRVDIAETVDMSHHSGMAVSGMGFGLPPERLGSHKRKYIFSRYYFDSLAYLAHILGVRLDRITADIRYRVADRPISTPAVQIEVGTVATINGWWTGYRNGTPYVTLRERLYLDPAHVEDTDITSPDFYDVSVTGHPLNVSTRVNMAVTAETDVLGIDDAQCGANLATAVQLVQAVPIVVRAKPGILLPEIFMHGSSDFRFVEDPSLFPPQAVPEEIL